MRQSRINRSPASGIIFIFVSLFTVCCKKNKEKESDFPVLGTCQQVEVNAGLLSFGDGIYEYKSAGRVTFRMQRSADLLVVTLTDASYPNLITYQLWGKMPTSGIHAALHENLNGKYIKNRIGNNRTIFFPDGTKVTCVSSGPENSITAVSIYDGAKVHHLNITCDKVELSTSDSDMAKRLDELQPDGETSTYELTPTGLVFYNIYTEDAPGNKVQQRVDLGSLEADNPNQVNDLYDDPRLAHT